MAADGARTPLDYEPDIAPHLGLSWCAFWDLCDERSLSLGPGGAVYGAIPWTAIDRYAARAGLADPDDFQPFVEAVRGMDAEWRDWMHRKDR